MNRLVYGYYPEIVTKPGEEGEILKLLDNSYLYKDLLMLEQLKKPMLLKKLLKALALQIRSEVSCQELSQTIGSDNKTVDKYLDLLEKAFVVFRLPALNRNVRNEIKKGKKVYFFDCGIRKAILNNFSPLASRTDAGHLWENFVIAGRMKYKRNNNLNITQYFWRTTQQPQIDLVEETIDQFFIFECKRNPKATARFPLTFTQNYSFNKSYIVNPQNIEEVLL